MENHSGEGGPRYELQELLVWLEGVRKIQRFLGFAESELTYLYDIAVWGNTPIFPAPLPSPWKSERLTATHCLSCRVLLKPRPVVDNCSANRAQNGLLSMIDIVRRYEYEYLKTIRSGMGKFVATVTVSCQLHDSNLVNVLLSKLLRMLDTTEPDPFQPEINPAVPEIKGNKQTESFSFNAVRFLATCFKRSKEWKAFMLSEYGDTQGIKSIKSARFWAVSLRMHANRRIELTPLATGHHHRRSLPVPPLSLHLGVLQADHQHRQGQQDEGGVRARQADQEDARRHCQEQGAGRVRLAADGRGLRWFSLALQPRRVQQDAGGAGEVH